MWQPIFIGLSLSLVAIIIPTPISGSVECNKTSGYVDWAQFYIDYHEPSSSSYNITCSDNGQISDYDVIPQPGYNNKCDQNGYVKWNYLWTKYNVPQVYTYYIICWQGNIIDYYYTANCQNISLSDYKGGDCSKDETDWDYFWAYYNLPTNSYNYNITCYDGYIVSYTETTQNAAGLTGTGSTGTDSTNSDDTISSNDASSAHTNYAGLGSTILIPSSILLIIGPYIEIFVSDSRLR